MKQDHFARYARSLFSGGISAVVSVVSLFLFTEYAHYHYLLSSLFAYAVALIVNFTLQRYWVFVRTDRPAIHNEFIRYGMLVAINAALNTCSMFVLTEYFGVWYVASFLIVTIVLSILNYMVAHRYVFTSGTRNTSYDHHS